jgi:hypothetical protein
VKCETDYKKCSGRGCNTQVCIRSSIHFGESCKWCEDCLQKKRENANSASKRRRDADKEYETKQKKEKEENEKRKLAMESSDEYKQWNEQRDRQREELRVANELLYAQMREIEKNIQKNMNDFVVAGNTEIKKFRKEYEVDNWCLY